MTLVSHLSLYSIGLLRASLFQKMLHALLFRDVTRYVFVFSLFVVAAMVSTDQSMASTEPQLGQASIEEVIAALTLEEKVRLLRGKGMNFPGGSDEEGGPSVGVVMGERVPGASGSTHAVPRFGISSLVVADGPAGVRISPTRADTQERFHATAFPIATLLATSWDIELVERVGHAMGHEVKEYGVDVLLAPAMNLHRFPLGGRNFEYYSEDPLVSGKVAAAMVRGIQSQGVGTSIKHFVANNHEWNRFTLDVKVDERSLRELYLRGFEIAVKEGRPWTLMSSYNKVNGEYTSESPRLLTQILRDEWGYQGLVMTDWFGGQDPAGQMRAGNDLLMPGADRQEQAILKAVEDGVLDEAFLDRNLEKLLRLILKTPTFSAYSYSDRPNLAENAAIARRAAAQGMVLLKNQSDVLPLVPTGQVALIGTHAYDLLIGGTGSGDVNEAYSVSLQAGLENQGVVLDAELSADYLAHIEAEKSKRPILEGIAAFMPVPPIPELALEADLMEHIATRNSAALVVIGRSSGEFTDREAEGDFYLTQVEQDLLEKVSRAFRGRQKPVIAILNIGGVIETASWRDKVDAILLAWQPGQEGGNAIADILLGQANPSGKLADTFPLRLEDFPQAKNFPGRVTGETTSLLGFIPTTPAEIEYEDGIWVGYRHFNSLDKEVAYCFGHGLSYTQFSYGEAVLSDETFDGELTASIRITNVGERAGKEAVQVYLAAPEGGMQKPSEELRAFAKTGLLAPGESQTLTFRLHERDLSSFDAARGVWVAAAGEYRLKIGASSRDIRAVASFHKASESLVSP